MGYLWATLSQMLYEEVTMLGATHKAASEAFRQGLRGAYTAAVGGVERFAVHSPGTSLFEECEIWRRVMSRDV